MASSALLLGKQRTSVRRRNRQNTRELLLEVAAELFARKGLQGLTLTEIAGAIDMSGPAIYNHFPSKDELFSQVVCQMYEEEVVAFRNALDPLNSIDAGLSALLDLVPQLYREDSVLQLLGMTAQLEATRKPETYSKVARASKAREQVAIDLAFRAKAAGELPDGLDPGEVGAVMMSLFLGGMGYRSLDASTKDEFRNSVRILRWILGLESDIRPRPCK